jgi:ferrous iron transport protein B
VDSNCLERSLNLVAETIATGTPTAVLLNMTDELQRIGMSIDTELLSKQLGVPVFAISARNEEGLDQIKALIAAHHMAPGTGMLRPRHQYDTVLERRQFAKAVTRDVVKHQASIHTLSDRIDRYVMHKVWGPLIFAGVVLVVFQAVFSWAGPLMDGVDAGFGALSNLVIRIGGKTLWTSLITDGVIAGVGGVVIFLPQILLIFLFAALMENSGYLARAATVMDRVFRIVGLQGKSFLPFISSYACAVPGIMAARIIENRRERLATIFVAPFMTCSARLPVYALMIAAFIPKRTLIPGILGLQSFTLMSMYGVGFVAALLTAALMRSRVMKKDLTPFRIEIPPYRWPSLKSVLWLMWNRSKIFLRRAGTVILAANLIIWALASFPRVEGKVVLEHTLAGKLGKTIEPLIEPLGFDWKIGIGLVASQAAREVIVSTLSTIYSLENADESSSSLQDAVRSSMTPLAGVSLMVYFALAMQCMSTVAVVRRETGGWRIPIIQFVYMNVLAYVAALGVYQGGRLFM